MALVTAMTTITILESIGTVIRSGIGAIDLLEQGNFSQAIMHFITFDGDGKEMELLESIDASLKEIVTELKNIHYAVRQNTFASALLDLENRVLTPTELLFSALIHYKKTPNDGTKAEFLRQCDAHNVLNLIHSLKNKLRPVLVQALDLSNDKRPFFEKHLMVFCVNLMNLEAIRLMEIEFRPNMHRSKEQAIEAFKKIWQEFNNISMELVTNIRSKFMKRQIPDFVESLKKKYRNAQWAQEHSIFATRSRCFTEGHSGSTTCGKNTNAPLKQKCQNEENIAKAIYKELEENYDWKPLSVIVFSSCMWWSRECFTHKISAHNASYYGTHWLDYSVYIYAKKESDNSVVDGEFGADWIMKTMNQFSGNDCKVEALNSGKKFPFLICKITRSHILPFYHIGQAARIFSHRYSRCGKAKKAWRVELKKLERYKRDYSRVLLVGM